MGFYKLVAFVGGMVVLAVEITAFRIVAPYFGNSIFITTNLLGVILAALALGYWLGGRAADKRPRPEPLYVLMIGTAFITAIIPFAAPILLQILRSFITDVNGTLIILSLAGSAILFFLPFVLLGMISPWLIRLATRNLGVAGRTAGSLFAWSTLGSLLGTFLPTLITVPLIGTKRTILLFSAMLALVAAVGLVKARWFIPALVIASLLFVVQPKYFAAAANVVEERESAMEYLRVISDGNGAVHLEQDEGFGIHSVYDPATFLTGMYFEWVMLGPALRKTPAEAAQIAPGNGVPENLDVGIVGLAGGTTARQFIHYFSNTHVTGAELDPETVELARKYFGLGEVPPEQLTIVPQDGRVWLSGTSENFDTILVDAFRQLYIPPHLSSREFFTEVQGHLKPGGIAIVNLNAIDTDSIVYRKMAATIRDVFPNVLAVAIPNSYNYLFFASNEPLNTDALAERMPTELRDLAEKFTDSSFSIERTSEPRLVATDDRPLVESLYDFMIARWLFKSGSQVSI